MEATPEAALSRRFTDRKAVTLREAMVDYVEHLKRHLAQIFPEDRTGTTALGANSPNELNQTSFGICPCR
jgi:hypothetical protein